MGGEDFLSDPEDGLLALDGNARVVLSIDLVAVQALLDLAGALDTSNVRDTLDSSAVTAFLRVQVTLEGNDASTAW